MMTTSMYVPSSTPRRPPPSKVQAPPPKTKPTQNLMTQSVYTPSRAVGMTASAPRATLRSSPGARLPPAKQRALPKPAAQVEKRQKLIEGVETLGKSRETDFYSTGESGAVAEKCSQ